MILRFDVLCVELGIIVLWGFGAQTQQFLRVNGFLSGTQESPLLGDLGVPAVIELLNGNNFTRPSHYGVIGL